MISNDVMNPIVLGREPVSELDMYKYCRLVKDPIVGGRVPLNLFAIKLRLNRLVNNPIALGNVPDNLLLLKSKCVMDVIDPIVSGIVPVSKLFDM